MASSVTSAVSVFVPGRGTERVQPSSPASASHFSEEPLAGKPRLEPCSSASNWRPGTATTHLSLFVVLVRCPHGS